MVEEGLVAYREPVRPAFLRERSHRDVVGDLAGGPSGPQVGAHPVEPPGLLVAVLGEQRHRIGVPGQAPADDRQREVGVAVQVQRDRGALGPAEQPGADPAVTVSRADAAVHLHPVRVAHGDLRRERAEADHRLAVVDRDRSAAEVVAWVGDLVKQVRLAPGLIGVVGALDGREQVGPLAGLCGVDRPPVVTPPRCSLGRL